MLQRAMTFGNVRGLRKEGSHLLKRSEDIFKIDLYEQRSMQLSPVKMTVS